MFRVFQRGISILVLGISVSLALSLAAAAEATKVDVFYPAVSHASQSLVLTGTVEAKQDAELAPLRSGVIAELFAEQGDRVEAGQKLMAMDAVLAELELQRYMAEVASAQAAKVEAERLYQEILGLSQKRLVPQTQREERRSAVAVADAEFKRAAALLELQQEILRRHVLYAPFSGVIAARNVDKGEWVTEQVSVFTLVEQQNLRLKLDIPQEYYGQLADQTDIDVILVPDFEDAQPTQVTLSRLVSVVNNTSRTMTALVDLPDETLLVPGMSARAEVFLPKASHAVIWIPKSSIKQHPDGGSSIFTVEQSKAKRYLVEIVRQQQDKVAVKGAPEAEAIVISGVELLRDGTELEINKVTGEKP